MSTLTKRYFLFIFFIMLALLFFGAQHTAFMATPSDYDEVTKSFTVIPPNIKKTLGIEKEFKQTQFRVPILMYHYIEHVHDKNDVFRELMNTNPELFEEQIKTLQNAGYTFMTMRDLGEIIDNKRLLPQKPIILTFDDGYADFAVDALPLLQKYQAKGTAYVVPGFTGESNYMTRKQLEAVLSTGLIEIGAHTVHHMYLSGGKREEVYKEILYSKKMLEFMLGIPIVSFAYPYGAYDEQAITLTKDAGFTTAVSTIPGITVTEKNRYFIYRLRPGQRTGEELTTYLEGDALKSTKLSRKTTTRFKYDFITGRQLHLIPLNDILYPDMDYKKIITIYDILQSLVSGMTTKEILHDFPELTEKDITAALEFAADREKKSLYA